MCSERMRSERVMVVGLATIALFFGLAACSDHWDDDNDIFITNASGCSLARITLDGVDKGPLGRGETRTLKNVKDGVHHLEAFRDSSEPEACDSHTTENLRGNDDDYWLVQCPC